MTQICSPSPTCYGLYKDLEMVRFYVDDIILVSKSYASIQYHLNNLYDAP